MTFGDNATFSLIGDVLQQKNPAAYTPLCEILYKDVGELIHKHCQNIRLADQDDLRQVVICAVLKRLPDFYQKSKDKSPKERNAWLRRVVENKRNDVLDKIKQTRERYTTYDDVLDPSVGYDFTEVIELRDTFFDALYEIFQIDTPPDKLIAFVYNRLLGTLSGKNGFPKSIVENFQGEPLSEMYTQMCADLSHVMQCSIPERILAPLKAKVDTCPGQLFFLSPRKISESSSWIAKTMKEQRKNES